MRETVSIPLLCPKCSNPLEKSRYASKGNWVTWWRIRCPNEACKVDTGEQAHLSAAYEAFAVLYLGAEANQEYKRNVPENEDMTNEDDR